MGTPAIVQQVSGDHNIFSATGDVTVFQLPQASAETRRLLLPLARKVEQFWIRGVLEHSVHNAALIELGKEQTRDAIEHPWGSTIELPGAPPQPVAPGQAIADIYLESGRALLILGSPGSGKTITLLELARALIARFENEPNEPVPVVINLSTWNEKHGALGPWVEAELRTKYFVPPKRAHEWLEASQLLLLLDGLDEVPGPSRTACVRAINTFLETGGLPGIVVCSRLREYLALPERLKFTGAIQLQPLTTAQIDDYLVRGGPQLGGVRALIGQDATLRDLAASPLMLSVLSLACQGMSPAEVSAQSGDAETRRAQLFESYVQRMFARVRQGMGAFSEPQTRAWLGWLARQLKSRSQTVFLLENLQPSWLPGRRDRWIYALTSRLASAVLWCGLWTAATLLILEQVRQYFWPAVVLSLVVALSVGLIAGTMTSLRLGRARVSHVKWKRGLALAGEILAYPVLMGMLFAMLAGPFFDPLEQLLLNLPAGSQSLSGWQLGLTTGVRYGVVFGVLYALRGARSADSPDIRLSETIGWSLPAAKRGARGGGIVGAAIGLLITAGYIAANWQKQLAGSPLWQATFVITAVTLVVMLVVGMLGALIAASFTMFTASESPRTTRPGQGILLTLQNAIRAAVVVGVLLAAVTIIYPLIARQPINWRVTLLTTSGWILAAAFWYGGFDLVQHLVLRVQLWWLGLTPARYVRFLDHAARLIFLQKVGSGYIFMHQRLLDFFAGEPRSVGALR